MIDHAAADVAQRERCVAGSRFGLTPSGSL